MSLQSNYFSDLKDVSGIRLSKSYLLTIRFCLALGKSETMSLKILPFDNKSEMGIHIKKAHQVFLNSRALI